VVQTTPNIRITQIVWAGMAQSIQRLELGVTDQYCALSYIAALFDMQTATCFDIMCRLQGASYVLIIPLFDTQAATCFDIMCRLQGASYVLIIPLFDTQAVTCFDIHLPSSGSFLCLHHSFI
jgi:hypothetical protein